MASGTKHREFLTALDAQEFYLKQKNHRYWHWDFVNGKYTLDYHNNVDASDKIIRIEEVSDTYEYEYVYDIETEDGTFQCGPGCMIVKNTDSIYTKFEIPNSNTMSEEELLKETEKVSEECAKRITETFKPPIMLEFEKIMYPILLVSKKRYAYQGYEPSKNKLVNTGVDVKGLQLVRRDNCPYVRDVCSEILEKILVEKNIQSAEQILCLRTKELILNEVPIEKLIISKKLKSKYTEVNKNGQALSKPAHWYLTQRMKERDPMGAPKPGDRVPYVFVEIDYDKLKKKKSEIKQCDRIEAPAYVVEKKINIDTLYYLDHQFKEPIYTIFSCIVKDKNGECFKLNQHSKISAECKRAIDKYWIDEVKRKQAKSTNQHQITNWFIKKKQK